MENIGQQRKDTAEAAEYLNLIEFITSMAYCEEIDRIWLAEAKHDLQYSLRISMDYEDAIDELVARHRIDTNSAFVTRNMQKWVDRVEATEASWLAKKQKQVVNARYTGSLGTTFNFGND